MTTENTKVHKEKKKKERGKGRNEKKTLASLQPAAPVVVAAKQHTSSNTEAVQHATVHHTEQQEHTSSTSLTSSHHNSSHLIDQVKPQHVDHKPSQPVTMTSQQASSESLNTQQAAATTSDYNIWHVTMEPYDSQVASNQATMEDAIAKMTSQSSSVGEVVTAVQGGVVQPTSVMVEVSTVQEQQQPKVITVDVHDTSPPHSLSTLDTAQLMVTKQQEPLVTSHEVTMVTKQQEPLVTSHHVTMEKTMTQTDTRNDVQVTAITAPSASITASPATKQSTESVDESDGSPQPFDTKLEELDFSDMKFNDILNDLLELSGEAEIGKKTTTTTTTTGKQSTDKTPTEYHTLSLFSDVPISAPPPPKSEQKTSQVTITVKKQEATKQQKTNDKSLNTIATSKDTMATNMVLTNKPTEASVINEFITMTTNKPAAEVSSANKLSAMTKESVTKATNKPAAPATGKHSVPLAVSHKKEMQQQQDGMDQEWSIDIGDLDIDLASQLEELNSIIGQLGGTVY